MHNNLLITFKTSLRLTQHSTYKTRNNTTCEGCRNVSAVFSVLACCKRIVIALTHFEYTSHGTIPQWTTERCQENMFCVQVLSRPPISDESMWKLVLCSLWQVNVNYRNLNYVPGGCFVTCMREISDKSYYNLRWTAQGLITSPKIPWLKISGYNWL